MSGPRWTIDNDGDAVWRDMNGTLDLLDINAPATPYNSAIAARAALVQCVRDADTLRKARQLAAELSEVESLDANPGHVRALLDLLTQDDDR